MCESVSCVALWCVIISYYYIERISSMILVRERGRQRKKTKLNPHRRLLYSAFPDPTHYIIYLHILIFITSMYMTLRLYCTWIYIYRLIMWSYPCFVASLWIYFSSWIVLTKSSCTGRYIFCLY